MLVPEIGRDDEGSWNGPGGFDEVKLDELGVVFAVTLLSLAPKAGNSSLRGDKLRLEANGEDEDPEPLPAL